MLRMVAPGKLFRFVAAEIPLVLSPPPGRHLLRGSDGEARTVVVVDAPPRPRPRRWRSVRRSTLAGGPTFDLASITVIDVIPQPGADEARNWVEKVAAEAAIDWAVDAIDRVLLAHRVASADPDVHELRRDAAPIWLAGYGTGEQVARGEWTAARELSVARRRQRRSEALRADERLPALLGGESPLLAEELTLRSRADLDHGRLAHAAVQLELALRAAIEGLERDERPGLRTRAAELRGLHSSVRTLAHEALTGTDAIARDTLAGALVRVEAALRARSAEPHRAARRDTLAADRRPERKI